jgi:hypothetical protein
MARFTRPLILAALVATLASPAMAQSSDPAAATRSPDGRPIFDGVWTNASATKLERSPNFKALVVPKAEADAMEQRAVAAAKAGGAPSDLSKGAFKDANSVAGYNSFWTDPGNSLARVRGEARSSYITDPADGRLPFRDRARSLAEPIREGTEYRSGAGAYEGPEVLPLRERCLISQSDGGGPIMLNGLYNNNYEFHLTKDYLVIEVEMVHDARIYSIYPTAAEARAHHKPAAIKPWLGDSVAWWEGDTLVAETRNVNPIQAAHTSTPLSPEATVTERFTRIDPGELLYQFSVEDPVHYTKTWSGEYAFKPQKGVLYEYACHEGNYSVPGILRGARLKEASAAKTVRAKP